MLCTFVCQGVLKSVGVTAHFKCLFGTFCCIVYPSPAPSDSAWPARWPTFIFLHSSPHPSGKADSHLCSTFRNNQRQFSTYTHAILLHRRARGSWFVVLGFGSSSFLCFVVVVRRRRCRRRRSFVRSFVEVRQQQFTNERTNERTNALADCAG